MAIAAAGLLAGCGESPGGKATADTRPDVVLITLDTLRTERIGCYGYHRAITPNLDAFAAEATQFNRANVPMPLTGPSHATMMTGLHPLVHGVMENCWVLNSEVAFLPELLAEAGYTTASVTAVRFLCAYGMERGFDWVDKDFGGKFERPARVVSDSAMDYLDRTPDRPRFLWVHYFDPHDPYRPPREFLPLLGNAVPSTPAEWEALERRLEEELRATRSGAAFRTYVMEHYGNEGQTRPANPEGRYSDALRKYLLEQYAYDGEIQYMDQQLGRVLDHLKQQGRYDDALIMILADHGEAFGEHPGDVGHGERLYDTTVRVAWLVKLPGQTAPQRVDRLVSSVDLLPTLLDVLALPVPSGCEGRSLAALLEGGPAPWTPGERLAYMQRRVYERFANAETKPAKGAGRPYDTEMFAVRDARWKLIWQSTSEHELYDMDADPGEQHNVIAAHPDTAAQLEAELQAWRDDAESRSMKVNPAWDEETVRMLKSLGYIK